MLTFRKDIIDKILQSSDSSSIEAMLRSSMESKFENKSNLLRRFVKYLESDINFHLRQDHSKKEQRNLMEALHAIRRIELTK